MRLPFFRFFVEFTVIFSSSQPHLQLPAAKENAGTVVGEDSEATGIGLDKLDSAIETATIGVGLVEKMSDGKLMVRFDAIRADFVIELAA